MKLSNEELSKIDGGIALKTSGIVLGGIISFILGFFDGFIRPLKCN